MNICLAPDDRFFQYFVFVLFIVANFCKCSRGPQSVATQLRVLFATTIVPRYTAKSEKFGHCWLERCWNSPNDILEFNFYYTTFSYHFLFPCFFHLDSQNICQNNRVFSLAAAYITYLFTWNYLYKRQWSRYFFHSHLSKTVQKLTKEEVVSEIHVCTKVIFYSESQLRILFFLSVAFERIPTT